MKNVWPESFLLALGPAEMLTAGGGAGTPLFDGAAVFVSVHARAPANKRLLYINEPGIGAQRGPEIS